MTRGVPTAIMANALIVLSLTPASGQRVEQWESKAFENSAFVSDCRDCEEDRIIAIDCKRGSPWVNVSLPGAAVENGKKNARVKVVLSTKEFRRSYQGRIDEQGLIGFLPEFKIRLSDPLFEALAKGQALQIQTTGQTTTASLNGSRAAITKFKRACRHL